MKTAKSTRRLLAAIAAVVAVLAVPSTAGAVGPPIVTTEAALSTSKTEATLNGTVNPNGLATQYVFQYGTTLAYGSVVPLPPKAIGSGTSPIKVSEVIKGLTPNTTYHFRVVAANSAGTTNGADREFIPGTVTLVDAKTGEALGVGAAVIGTSNNTKFIINGQNLTCGTVEFTGIVAQNGKNPAYVSVPSSSIEFPTCYNLESEKWPPSFSPYNFEMSVVEFRSEGVANFDFKFTYAGGCTVTGTGSETWNSGLEGSLLNFNQSISAPPGCLGGVVLQGTFNLTKSGGAPIEIVEK